MKTILCAELFLNSTICWADVIFNIGSMGENFLDTNYDTICSISKKFVGTKFDTTHCAEILKLKEFHNILGRCYF